MPVRPRVTSDGGGGGAPAYVQSGTASTGSGTAASVAPALPAPATAGNLLVVAANSDATLTISGGGGGWSLAVSAVNAQGLYQWYKIATGGETDVTVTPSVTDTVCAAILEYSSIAAASTLDQTASATRVASSAVTQATGTTSATGQAVELVVAAVGPHSYSAGVAPSSPSWVTATNRVELATTYSTAGQNAALFVGDYVTGAAAAQSDTCTWTNSSQDAGGAIATFRGA